MNIIFPALIVLFPLIFVFRFNQIKLTYLNLGFGLLFLAELFALIFSGDFLNSFEAFNRFLVVLLIYILFRVFWNEFRDFKIFLAGLFVASFILMIVSVLSFLSFKNELATNGFTDLTQFKYLYHPLNKIKINTFTNLWASVLIVFLASNTIFFYKLKNKFLKIIVGSGIFLNLFCMLATLSRGTYLALIVFWLFANAFLIKRLRLKRALIANMAVLTMVIFSAVIIGNSVQTTLAFSKTTSQQRSTSGRIFVWKKGFQMISEKPVFGRGQKNYKLAFEKNPIVAEDIVYSLRTNNSYLQLIIEKGIFGLVTYAIFTFLILFIVIKNMQRKNQTKENKIIISLLLSGIIALLVRDFTFSTFFDNDMVYFLAFFLVFNMIPYDVSIKKIEIGAKQKPILFLSVTLIVVSISVGNIYKWQAEKNNNKFVTCYLKNEIQKGILYLNKAKNLLPENFELNRHKAFALDKNAYGIDISANHENLLKISVYEIDSLKKAVVFYEKALQKRPNNIEILQNLGWVFWGMANEEAAEKYFNVALEKNKYDLKTLTSLFLLKIQNNKIEEATNILAKLLRYSPSLLESKLYHEFSVLYPSRANQAKLKAVADLTKKTENENNFVYKARLARLLILHYS